MLDVNVKVAKATLEAATTHDVNAGFLAGLMRNMVQAQGHENKADDSAYNNVVGLTLITLEKVSRAMRAGSDSEESRNRAFSNVWTMFLKQMAYSGFEVFEGQDTAAIMRIRNKAERAQAVNALFKESKGVPKVKAIRRVHGVTRKVIADVLLNQAEAVQGLATLNSGESQYESVRGIVATYGDNVNQLIAYFKGESKASKHWTESTLAKVEKASYSDVERLSALALAINNRIAELGRIAELVTGEDSEEDSLIDDSDIAESLALAS